MRPTRQRHEAFDAARQRQAEEGEAARQRLLAMAQTGEPTPPVTPPPCCEGRVPGHTGQCWPLGGTHPAAS